MRNRSHEIRVESRPLLIILVIGLLTFIACSDSTKPKPSPEPSPSDLLTSMLSVAVIPGGSETITVTAFDDDGLPEACDVSCNDDAIATVTSDGSSFVVTGVDYGNTSLAITTQSGNTKNIPVTVYDHRVLDTGELLVTYTDRFTWLRSYDGTGMEHPHSASFFHPIPPEGFYALGSYGFLGYEEDRDIDGEHAVMVVKPKEGSDAVAFPTECVRVSNFSSSPSHLNQMKPIPPSGYKAMGMVSCTDYVHWCGHCLEVACIREDLTIPGRVIDDKDEQPDSDSWFYDSHFFYYDDSENNSYCPSGTRGITDFWKIFPPEHEYQEPGLFYLDTGTYVTSCSADAPAHHDVMNSLRFEIPLLMEAPEQYYTPRLTGYDTPPGYSDPVMSREVLVPCTIIHDELWGDDIGLQVEHSPFYRLERQVFYKLVGFINNTTSTVQPLSVHITVGISEADTRTFSTETEITISAEVGVSIECFSSKVSVSLSRTFGYESSHQVAEFSEWSDWIPIYAPPYTAVACWQKFNRFVLKRHHGTSLETVAEKEIGIKSWVTDQYPDL
jgi:hypothetical protein